MIGIIYKYTSPENKIYIGQTINEAARRTMFLDFTKNYAGEKINEARLKYDPQNFVYEVIEKFDLPPKELKSKLNEREIYWINHYKSGYPEFGYNIVFGHQPINNKRNYRKAKVKTKYSVRKKLNFLIDKTEYYHIVKISRGKLKLCIDDKQLMCAMNNVIKPVNKLLNSIYDKIKDYDETYSEFCEFVKNLNKHYKTIKIKYILEYANYNMNNTSEINKNTVPVEIYGIKYNSISEAAIRLNVTIYKVRQIIGIKQSNSSDKKIKLNNIPIKIDDVIYDSIIDAAKKLDLPISEVCKLAGITDVPIRKSGNQIQVEIDGVLYDSISEAARALNISTRQVYKKIDKQF